MKLHPDKESCRFKVIEKSHFSRCRLARGFTITNMIYDSSEHAGMMGGESVYIRTNLEWGGTAHSTKNMENEVI